MQVPSAMRITAVLPTDVDLDGRTDVVLALHDAGARRRSLQVHLQQTESPRFRNEPSRPPYRVESDVVAFAYADVDAAAGRELVLLTPERVVAVTRGEDKAPVYRVLLDHPLVWPAADPERVLPLAEACCDFDGDGRDDLLLPRPDGWCVALRPGDSAGRTVQLELPPWQGGVLRAARGAMTADELRLSVQTGDEEESGGRTTGPLASIRTRTPPSLLADLDGDGRVDLGAVRNERLFTLRQSEGAVTSSSRPLPLPPDRLALFDPAFDVQLRDLDGDRRADLLLVTSASRNDEIEVRVDLLRSREDGTWPERPDSRLRVQTLALPARLVDADGDGVLDLVLVTVRTDVLRNLTGGEPTALDAQLSVFRGDGGRFVQPPLANQALQLPAAGRSGVRPFVHVQPGRQGEPGAVLLVDAGALVRRPLERRGSKLVLGAPSSRLPLAENARPMAAAALGDDVLVVGEHEVLIVRMR